MMNCFCAMADRRKAFSLISSRDHCQRSSPSRISDTPRAGFEPVQNLSSGFVEWSCAVVITTIPRRHYIHVFIFLYATCSSTYKGYWQIKNSNRQYFFNSLDFTTLSGNVTHSISDHVIQFVILEDFMTPKPLPKTNMYKRNFDKFDNSKLKGLHKIDWINEILKNSNDINEIFDIFYKT